LNDLAVGVCLLDGRGRVTFVNDLARAMLSEESGLVLTNGGQLRATSSREGRSFARIVAGACATGARPAPHRFVGLSVGRGSGRRPLAVVAASLRLRRPVLRRDAPVAVVFISDSERDVTTEPLLREIYGLTPAEARVAKLLVAGLRIEDVGTRLRITTATVRTHVRRLFDKIDVRSRADLVRVIARGPAVLVLAARGAAGDP